MNKAQMDTMQEIAQNNGLSIDAQSETIFGMMNGYEVCLTQVNQSLWMMMSFSVSRGGLRPDAASMKEVVKMSKILGACTVSGSRVNITVKNGLHKKNGAANVSEALHTVTMYMRTNGYENCCQNCGTADGAEAYILGGGTAILCPNCFAALSNSIELHNQTKTQKKENVVGGIVGALLGSLVGVFAIVILGQLGYVAALSGVVMGICALKGYELLAGKLSTKGVVISAVVMIIMVYMGYQTDWAITVASYFETGFFESFRAIPQLISEGYIESSNYYGNLALSYLFTAGGAIPTVMSSMKNRKMAFVTYKMGA
ncbi:MAG: hypothetical protein EOM40_03920 [Clostridia bacterium]|nr:hypothetical protein [Clostridia bacterium]NCC44866.1 hypothetical protein [Clostridia bacterium]